MMTRKRPKLCREACALERQIANTNVVTIKGLAAKIRAVAAAGFDDHDMPDILEGLALDAERIAAAG